MVDVVDDQQPAVPPAQHPGRAVQHERVGVAQHPRGQVVGRASVGQQPSPRQTAMLAADRGGAQHLEPAAGALAGCGSGQFGAARPRRAGEGQHAAATVGGTVKQAPDLGRLAAPPG